MSKVIIVSQAKNDLELHYEKISSAWYKTTESIIETARYLLEAKEQLSLFDYKKLTESLVENSVMSLSTISKLKGIAENQVLCNPDNQKLLPPSYETLYLLSLKDETVLEEKLLNNEINAETNRKELTAIFRSDQTTSVPKLDVHYADRIIIKGDLSTIPKKDFQELIAILKKLKNAGIEVSGGSFNAVK